MKLTKYFMPFAALALLASCSDKADQPTNVIEPGNGTDFYLNLDIKLASNTRAESSSTSPSDKIENGQDEENTISSGFLVLTDDQYNVKAYGEIASNDLAGNASTGYKASFQLIRETVATDIANNGGSSKAVTYKMFMIANPNDGIKTSVKAENAKFNFDFNRDESLWGDDAFLMTNADYAECTIKESDVAAGEHTSKATALNLGEVIVQRAMSRFDFNTAKVEFDTEAEENTEDADKVSVEIVGLAIVNEAKDAKILKEVGDVVTKTTQGSDWDFFWVTTKYNTNNNNYSEGASQFVFSPAQAASTMVNPLFGATTNKDFSTFTYTSVDDLDTPDNAYTGNTDNDPAYYILGYAMENTFYDGETEVDSSKDQKKGETTAIIFKAQITGSLFDGQDDIYAYQNLVLGTFKDIKSYLANDENKSDSYYSSINTAYNAAKAKGTLGDDGSISSGEDDIKAEMVKGGFTIYSYDEDTDADTPAPGYYCYYVYYNRHNDNGENTNMGIMEFATVRNNVYKLQVTGINKLGHPADPSDDPDPEKPGDPDESDEFWGEVSCTILPWSVRINDIVF